MRKCSQTIEQAWPVELSYNTPPQPPSSGGCGCEEMYGYGQLLNECISTIAVKTNNPELCSDKDRRREICQERKGPGIGADYYPVCEENLKKNCLLDYLSKASINNNLNINCDDFGSGASKFKCIEIMAIAKNNWQTCLDINEQVYQNGCIYNFALKNRDNTLCYRMKNIDQYTNEAEQCKEKVDMMGDPKNKPDKDGPYRDELFEYAIIHKDPSLCPRYGEWSESSDGNLCKILAK